MLKIVALAPLKVVTFGAWRMLFRASPWAAVRKRYTSRSLRNEMPRVAPARDGVGRGDLVGTPLDEGDLQVVREVARCRRRGADDERQLAGQGVVEDRVDAGDGPPPCAAAAAGGPAAAADATAEAAAAAAEAAAAAAGATAAAAAAAGRRRRRRVPPPPSCRRRRRAAAAGRRRRRCRRRRAAGVPRRCCPARG